MLQRITIRTIGDFLDYEHRLSGFCNGCRRYIELDLEALARRFGRDFDTKGIGPRLVEFEKKWLIICVAVPSTHRHFYLPTPP